MGRQIKFRAWVQEYNPSKEAATMVYSDRVGGVSVLFRDFEEDPIMQFTGWNDSEGEPIFEGDILECEDHFYYQILWSEKHACWYASDCGGLDDLPSDVKVIGNIYQNPELFNDTTKSK